MKRIFLVLAMTLTLCACKPGSGAADASTLIDPATLPVNTVRSQESKLDFGTVAEVTYWIENGHDAGDLSPNYVSIEVATQTGRCDASSDATGFQSILFVALATDGGQVTEGRYSLQQYALTGSARYVRKGAPDDFNDPTLNGFVQFDHLDAALDGGSVSGLFELASLYEQFSGNFATTTGPCPTTYP